MLLLRAWKIAIARSTATLFLVLWLRTYFCSPWLMFSISHGAKESFDGSLLTRCCGFIVAFQQLLSLSWVLAKTIPITICPRISLPCTVGQSFVWRSNEMTMENIVFLHFHTPVAHLIDPFFSVDFRAYLRISNLIDIMSFWAALSHYGVHEVDVSI